MRQFKGSLYFVGAVVAALLAHAAFRLPTRVIPAHVAGTHGRGDDLTTLAVVAAVVGLIALGFGFAKVRKLLHRLCRRGFVEEWVNVKKRDRRQPFLLLRAFDDDDRFMVHGPRVGLTRGGDDGWVRGEVSLEEALVKVLTDDYGPVVAIGRPGEWAPPLGAARHYVTGDWQSEVRDWIHASRMIVVILGSTPGLGWELEQLLRLRVLPKVVLVLPPVPPDEHLRRWRRFAAAARAAGVAAPTRVGEEVVFVTFARDGDFTVHTAPDLRRGWFGGGRRARNYTSPFKALIRATAGEPDRPARAGRAVNQLCGATLALGALSLLFGAVSLWADFETAHEVKGGITDVRNRLQLVVTTCSVLSVPWGAVAIPAGIGLLRRRPWGRALCLACAAGALVIGAVVLSSRAFGADPFFASVIPAFYAGYALWAVVVMALPSTRREFS